MTDGKRGLLCQVLTGEAINKELMQAHLIRNELLRSIWFPCLMLCSSWSDQWWVLFYSRVGELPSISQYNYIGIWVCSVCASVHAMQQCLSWTKYPNPEGFLGGHGGRPLTYGSLFSKDKDKQRKESSTIISSKATTQYNNQKQTQTKIHWQTHQQKA